MKRVLFVCTGNTCRSSMAEGIFNSLVANDADLAGRIMASSAGVSAYEGDCASPESILALKDDWGIDISAHRSRSVSEEELKSVDLVLTMTCGHKEVIISWYPEIMDKVFTLKEFVKDSDKDKNNFELNITDPYGMSQQIYKICAREIREAIEKFILKLKTDNNV